MVYIWVAVLWLCLKVPVCLVRQYCKQFGPTVTACPRSSLTGVHKVGFHDIKAEVQQT